MPTVTVGKKAAPRDENAPRSKPLHAGDQYIRKRMIIERTDCADPAVLSALTVGTYVDIMAEPTASRGKSAVALFLQGERIGYVPDFDTLMFVTPFRLNRRAYGVITEVIGEVPLARYQFEAWLFDGKLEN